jgi:hypothetical protein
MQDFQCQFGEFMTIENFHHTGLLSILDARGVPRDIFRDSNSLVLSDFERADARLLSDSSPSGLALAKLSTLLFLKLQNLCTPAFQATLRGSYKPFYGTSFLLYYAYMLEYCHMSGVGTVIDIELAREQLSQSKLVLAFRTHLYDVVKFFADIVRLVDQLSRLGSSKEDLCGAILFALSTCPDADFVRFINALRRDFILKQGSFFHTFTDTAQFDYLRKTTVAEFSLLSKDNRYNVGSSADGFVLVAGKHQPPPIPGLPVPPAGSPTFANKADWEYQPPLPGKSNKREVEGRSLYWCVHHAHSPRCLHFINTGQWVVHHPTQCRLKKTKSRPPSVPPPVPATALVAATPAVPAVLPSPATGALSYSTVASGEPLLMRTKLKQVLDGGDPTQVAGLFAAYHASCLLDDVPLGDAL